jgi:hypothetical protein
MEYVSRIMGFKTAGNAHPLMVLGVNLHARNNHDRSFLHSMGDNLAGQSALMDVGSRDDHSI